MRTPSHSWPSAVAASRDEVWKYGRVSPRVAGVAFADWTIHVRSLSRLLDGDERAESSRRLGRRSADHYVITHGVLRLAIGRELGVSPSDLTLNRRACHHCGAAHGGPALGGAQAYLSLSRTDDRALIALGEADVGVDIERHRPIPDPDAVLGQVRAPGEVTPRSDAGVPAQLDWWVRKEAMVKATGEGLLSARRYDVAEGAPEGWCIASLAAGPQHSAALAFRESEGGPPERIEWLRPQVFGLR
jgi:4'-phosphopantetheinyl transferase